MIRSLDVPPAEAIAFLTMLVRWNGGVLPVYLDGKPQPETYLNGPSVADTGVELARRAARWDFKRSAQVEIGLPEGKRDNGGPGECTVLWAWIETRDSAFRLWKRFRPEPTLILRMGASCRRLAIWSLRESIPHVLVTNANKKLAYALHTPQKWAEPERLRIPLPGTFIRVGRKRPAPVLVTAMNFDNTYLRSQVVARLKDPPTPYMTRLRNGEVSR